MIVDALGRKKSHLLTIIPNLTGWFLLPLVNSVAGLIAARCFQGIAMGMVWPLGPIIIGEMTDPKYRGMFLTSNSLSLTLGILFCHTLGTYFNWMQCAIICSFTTFTSLLFIIYNPESPSWLVSKGRYEEAKEVFYWLRGNSEEQETELDKMIAAQNMLRKSSVAGQNISMNLKIRRAFRYFTKSCRKPEFFKPVLIMLFLYSMLQFAGINVISSYTTDIIEQVVGPEANSKLLMVLLDVERFIGSFLAIYLVKVLNRRTLLFSTGFICVLAYFGKAGYVFLKHTDRLPFDSQWIPIGFLALYMFSLSAGISSLPFAISGEIFPLEFRGLGSGISILAHSLNYFVAVKCFPVLTGAIGLPFTYVIYATLVILLLTSVLLLLPETKDRTLQDIENMFRGSPEDFRSIQPLNKISGEIRRCSSHIIG